MGWDACFATDEATVFLGLIAASTFLLKSLYKPQPLVHPVLLGRQSDASHVRQAGESAIYRNYGTGTLGRLALRPAKDINHLGDFVKSELDTPRTLWSTKITNPEINARVAALGSGFIHTVGLTHDSNVLLLLNDGLEFMLADLALAAHGIPSFTLSSLSLLSEVLDSHPPSAIITHGTFLPQLLELIYDSAEGEHHKVIVLGDTTSASRVENAMLFQWNEVERTGSQGPVVEPARLDPKSTFTVTFFKTPGGKLQAARLTHENMTAGVAATRVLLPLSNAISPLDTIVSAHSLSTAYGRAVAYTALYEGCSFATTDSSKLIHGSSPISDTLTDLTTTFTAYPIPSPTILFLAPEQFTSLWTAISTQARRSLVSGIAYRHKLSALSEGFVTKDSLWDRLVFDSARASIMGEGAGTVRAIIVAGKGLLDKSMSEARATMSVPIVHASSHPAVPAPMTASHPFDFQTFSLGLSDGQSGMHAGAPSVNLEAKILGINDQAVEAGGDPEGALYVRGPAVGQVLGEEVDEETEYRWLNTEERVRVQTNGCFKFFL